MSKYTLPPDDVLIAEYMECHSASKIARRLGCRPEPICDILREAGVLGMHHELDVDAIVADYVAGMRFLDICRKHHHATQRVWDVIWQSGVYEGRRRSSAPGMPAREHFLRIARTPLPAEVPTEGEWGYIAGCLDGEGTIYRPKTVISVTIVQKNRSMLDWIHQSTGLGEVRLRGDRAAPPGGIYYFLLRKQRHVYYFLRSVVDRLIVKKSLAVEAIAYLEERWGMVIIEGIEPEPHARQPLIMPSEYRAMPVEPLPPLGSDVGRKADLAAIKSPSPPQLPSGVSLLKTAVPARNV